jgi:ABC-type glycerol-3-phosphate transport system substrate-binding protein
MKKVLMSAAVSAILLGAAACSQGPNEEAGESADTAYEQSTTGTTDLGQGPQEEAGEQVDAVTGGEPAGSSTSDPAAPPATTP